MYEDHFLKTTGDAGEDKLVLIQNPLSCIFSSCSTEMETKIGVVVHAFKRALERQGRVDLCEFEASHRPVRVTQ